MIRRVTSQAEFDAAVAAGRITIQKFRRAFGVAGLIGGAA